MGRMLPSRPELIVVRGVCRAVRMPWNSSMRRAPVNCESRNVSGGASRAHENRVDPDGIAEQSEGLKQLMMEVGFKDSQ